MTLLLVIFLELLLLSFSKLYLYFDQFMSSMVPVRGLVISSSVLLWTIIFGYAYWISRTRNNYRERVAYLVDVIIRDRFARLLTILLLSIFCLLLVTHIFKYDLVEKLTHNQVDTILIFICITGEIAFLQQVANNKKLADRFQAFVKAVNNNLPVKQIIQIAVIQVSFLILLLNPKISLNYLYEILVIISIGFFYQLSLLYRVVFKPKPSSFSTQGYFIKCLKEYSSIVLLFILILVTKIVFITPLAHLMMAPTDGYQYWQMASLIFEGKPDILAYHHYPPLYSWVISLVFFFPISDSLKYISIINSILSSSLLFPVYFIARKYFSHSFSILIAAVCLIHPDQYLYTTHPASENLFYPILFWTLFLLLSSPKKPQSDLCINVLTGVFIALCYLTRYQTFPLIPVFLLIWWLKPTEENQFQIDWKPTKTKLLKLIIVMISFTVTFSIWLIPGLSQSVSIKGLLGFTVEGENSLLQFNRSFSSLLFWGGISTSYLILMQAPLLPIILRVIPKLRLVSRDPKRFHLLIAASLLIFVMLIVVVRHAWLAGYNTIEPTRLVTRYIIYAFVLALLSVLVSTKFLEKENLTTSILTTIISFILVIVSFELIFNQEWILPKRLLYIDAYLPFYAKKVFIPTIILSYLFILHQIWKKKYRFINIVVLLSVIYINLASFPQYHDYMITYQRGGRFIDELLNNGILGSQSYTSSGMKMILMTKDRISYPDKQLEVRGLSPSQFNITTEVNLPKGVVLVLEKNPEEDYIIQVSGNTKTDDQLVSKFLFGGIEYELLKRE